MTRKPGDFVAAAERYVAGVLSEKIPACEYVVAACQRQRDDLKRAKAKDFPYRFDVAAAERICKFAEMLPHVRGEWAERRGDAKKIHLEDWQCFLFTTLFGWLWKDDPKRRRFREVYWEIPRKNSKSTMAAIIGDFMWCLDGEAGAEVYSGATTEKQAWEVFRPARLMIDRSDDIVVDLGPKDDVVRAKSLHIPADGSRFEPLIGKPGDGASPSCAIADEFHEHDTSHFVDAMKTGMLARKRPLLIQITTAGVNTAGPCYLKRDTCIKVLQRSFVNEELFTIIYTLDAGDDWASPQVLAKANPNLGVSVDRASLEADQRQAVLNPEDQNRFKTRHLNVWCGAKVAWMSLVAWDANKDVALREEEFAGEPCRFILDLASRDDLACFAELFTRRLDGDLHHYFFAKYYLPEDALEVKSPNQVAYRRWKSEGWLVTTEGAEIDFDRIGADVLEARDRVQALELIYDPWRATQLAHQFSKEGVTTVEVRQTVQFLSPAMKEVLSATKAGRLHHDGNPITRWMVSNVVALTDAKDNIYPRKEKPHMKIDGAVALIMGMSRAMLDEDDGFASWLKSGGVTGGARVAARAPR